MAHRKPEVDEALSSTPEGPREKLLAAVLQEIERVGLGEVTVRGIVAASGMNIASVNYHFESKDKLIATAMHQAAEHLVKDALGLLQGGAPAADRIEALLQYLIEGGRRFPRVARGHLDDAAFSRRFRPIITALTELLAEAVPTLDEAALKRRAMAVISEAFFPSLFPTLFPSVLETAAQRSTYASEVAARAVGSRAPNRSR